VRKSIYLSSQVGNKIDEIIVAVGFIRLLFKFIMKIILVYDINEKRVSKILKICRKYLYWVQNSVFEGEITEAKFEKLKTEIKKCINTKEDSVIIYTFNFDWYTKREILGKEKGKEEIIL
jgi:CRISPR-associated protein Cas2